MFTRTTRSDFFSTLRAIGLNSRPIEDEMARFRINVPANPLFSESYPGDPIFYAISEIRGLRTRWISSGLSVERVLNLQIALEQAFEHYDRHASSPQEQRAA